MSVNGLVKDIGIIRGKIPEGRQSGMRRLSGDFLAMMTDGEAEYADAVSGKIHLDAPSVIYVPDGIAHSYDPSPELNWDNCWMLFDGARAKNSLGDILPEQPAVFSIRETSRIESDWRELCDIVLRNRPGSGHYAFSLLHCILARIHMQRSGIEVHDETSRFADITGELAQRAKEHEIDFRELAARYGFGYDNFRKQFRAHTGSSPKQYFLKLKINASKALLLNGSLSIKEIAEICGFESQYYFSRLFKEKTGLPPSKYCRRGRPVA